MHTTMVTSSAGQLRFGTTLTAIANIAIATPIFSISQNMKPAATATGFRVPLVMPRANKALGKTTAAAPYSADHTAPLRCVNAQTAAPHNKPAAACAATTPPGDKGGVA